ncbi:hypothetical protein F511_46231 [Dorcoceras hygrometricum]|uniref:Uncharacterized protein n=1 Tax=Dorcoceras hygrometricum TaxID=472368 RepID=A0A2Z6ZU08_9LAMI|nr:hypothetical protein F511_46231 [Dorcoceras hygrometricum]
MRAGRAWWMGAALHDAQALRRKLAVLVDASSLAGRTIAHMLAHVSDDGRAMAPLVLRLHVRRWARLCDARRRCWPAMVRTRCACSTLLVARAAAAFSWWRRRRRRPPLRRVSGDVVTAGLNSSRVWFGPVPSSP